MSKLDTIIFILKGGGSQHKDGTTGVGSGNYEHRKTAEEFDMNGTMTDVTRVPLRTKNVVNIGTVNGHKVVEKTTGKWGAVFYYDVAKALGLTDIVPQTVKQEKGTRAAFVDGLKSAVEVFSEQPDRAKTYGEWTTADELSIDQWNTILGHDVSEDMWKILMLDIITGCADRHAGNVGFVNGEHANVFDNEFAFQDYEDSLADFFYTKYEDSCVLASLLDSGAIPQVAKDIANDFLEKSKTDPAIKNAFAYVLDEDALEYARMRMKQFLKLKEMPTQLEASTGLRGIL